MLPHVVECGQVVAARLIALDAEYQLLRDVIAIAGLARRRQLAFARANRIIALVG